jgi:hypothetical protein
LYPEDNGTYYYNISSAGKIYKPSPGAGSITVNGANVSVSITFTEVTYTITFTESGLTSGTWYVNVSTTSQLFSEPYGTTTISFSEPNGTYSFTAQTNYKIDKPSPSSGSFIVNGASVSETITFAKVTYTITFTETGLTSGTWWANVSTTSQVFSEPYTTSTISFTETNGTYYWNVSTNYKLYYPTPASGKFVVNGANVSVSITFAEKTYTVKFVDKNLTSGNWYVNVTTTSQSFSSAYSSNITFAEGNGTYHFKVYASLVTASANPSSGNFTVNGTIITITITFTIEQYYLQTINITNSTVLSGLYSAGTNFLIQLPTGTMLYTEFISYTSGSSLDIKVVTPGSTSTIEFDEFPTFESYLTKSGYLENSSGTYNFGAVLVPSTMPSFSFGARTLFQANANPSNIGSVLPAGEFPLTGNNETYSYQVPVQPGVNYLTINWNDSWSFTNQGILPGTYVLETDISSLTFYSISGLAYVEVSIIEPNIAIGQQQPVSISLEQSVRNSTSAIPQSMYGEFSLSVSYVPYGETAPVQFYPGSFQFTLPFGSTAIATVDDYWQEAVGKAQFTVPDSSISVTIPVNMTELVFSENGTGASPPLVSIQSGNYNLTTSSPVLVKNGGSYRWFVSALDPQTYLERIYSNIVLATGAVQIVTVPIGSPISSLVINVYAYNGSGIGELANGGPSIGNPTAILLINNVSVPFSSTFEGLLGQTVNVTVKDVLGHILLQREIDLNSPLMTVNLNITTPSYMIGFMNDETIDPSSPLATQYSSISVLGTHAYYNFTTRVQKESEIYLRAGYTYHLYTHDNLTDTLNISLAGGNVFWAFNGQNITKITEAAFFNATISLSLYLSPISEVQTNKSSTFTLTIKLERANIFYNLTESQTLFLIRNLSIDLSLNGILLDGVIPKYVSPGVISFTILVNKTGSGYQISAQVSKTNFSGIMVSGSTYATFASVPFNPSNPPNPMQQFLTSTGAQLFYFLVTIITVIAYVYRRLTKKRTELDDEVNSAGVGIEGQVLLKGMNHRVDPSSPPLTLIEQQMFDAIPSKVKDKLIYDLTSGTVRLNTAKPKFRWRKIA